MVGRKWWGEGNLGEVRAGGALGFVGNSRDLALGKWKLKPDAFPGELIILGAASSASLIDEVTT